MKGQRCAYSELTFCATYRFGYKPLKLPKFRYVNDNDSSPMTELQVTACFWFDLCIPSYSGRSDGVPSLWRFSVRLTVLPLQGFEVTHPIFHDVTNVANEEACMKLVH